MPDPRDEQGQRHPLPTMLALASVALLCNCQTPKAIAEWVDNYGREYLELFGFTYPDPPGQATWYYRVLGAIDWKALEARVTQWALRVLQVLERHTTLEGMAIDGKTLRGSKQQGAEESHLLSAVVHQLGLTLAQVAVQDKTNEIGVVRDLLSKLVVEGYVFTTDALLTQQELAADILERGGDYVFVVKRNQPQLHADIALLFESPPPLPRGETWPEAERGTSQ